MMWLLYGSALIAAAQDADLADVAADADPTLDAQLFRPTLDADRTLWVDDSSAAKDLTWRAAVIGQHVVAPFVARNSQDQRVDLVESATVTHVLGAVTWRGLRLGLDVPLYLQTASETEVAGAGLGDLSFGAKARLLDRDKRAVGVAALGRLTVPTSTLQTALGARGATGELGAVVDGDAGPVRLAWNTGFRFLPAVDLTNVSLGHQFWWRGGAAWEIRPPGGVALEFTGHLNLTPSIGNLAALPLEVMASGWYQLPAGLEARAGLGRGLTNGIGAPTVRAVIGLAWKPKTKDRRPEPEIAAAPAEPTVPAAPDPATLEVRVTDPEGVPIAAQIRVADQSGVAHGGDARFELEPGQTALSIEAPGFSPFQDTFAVHEGAELVEHVVLRPRRAVLHHDRIEIHGEVAFDTNRADLKAESFDLLDEVAAILREHPELEILRIEGHTDSRGTDQANMDLSTRRAASVRTFLVNAGVQSERLTSQGFGESRPVVDGNDEAAWARNRRVVFTVVRRSD